MSKLLSWWRKLTRPEEILTTQWLCGDRFELRRTYHADGAVIYLWHDERGMTVSHIHRSEDVARVKFGQWREWDK